MRGGTRWQLPNGLLVETSKMKVLENDDAKDKAGLADLDAQKPEAILLELRLMTTAEQLDKASEMLRRFAADLEP